ncbi:alpha-tubulin suppressor-like RCC1 family protein [Lentzea atacamensis]|uniref:Alpha-tubulin suppressor-like RCC1 family protein n=1 Tax=Lentzea atacamensis TaxID=531938 RepID=A0A316HU72_9PSEU|nr:PKD domain-containing protein [Lentzea atacamensis]PWK84962.1 alpha-tubulin suppressor-like RCC1 family protein [Lentzea atacamensis]
MKSRDIGVALASVAVIAAAVLVAGPGYETSQARMYSGAAWLPSGQVGEVTLVNGASAEVTARVPVAGAGAVLNVAQQAGAAFVLNEQTGGLSRIDTATERPTAPVPVLPASDGLVVLPAPDTLHVVDVHSGMTASVDPATLTPRGEPRRLAEAIRPGNVGVDENGRLWAIDDTTGDLVWLSDRQRRTRSAATKNGHLTITDGRPALVDPERGAAELLDPETGEVAKSVRLDARVDDTAVIGGSTGQARVLIATGSRGQLVSCAFDTGCTEPVPVSSAGAELGTPIEVGNDVVVPNHSTGQATIVDVTTSRVVAQRQLFDKPTRFELVARDGILFFNDPNGDKAGVLDLAGDVRTITKYTDGPTTDEAPPAPDPRAQATKIDHRAQQPGLGLPVRASSTPRANPPPRAPEITPSIVVRPGNRGVVGDEFELTLLLRPAATATTRWSFGDGTEAAGATVHHRWHQPGSFTVRATATLGEGRTAESETVVTVVPAEAPPGISRIDFRRPRPVIGESVHFSADTTGRADRWRWTVTRPGTTTPVVTADTTEFDHRFAAPGVYTVSLTVTSGTRTAQSSRQLKVSRGAVKAWGSNLAGQTDVPLAASSGVVAIDAGADHSLALKADGSVIAWGEGGLGQTDVPLAATSGVIAIAAGTSHNLALKANGSVIAWGDDQYGQSTVPPQAMHDVVAIAAGGGHSVALKADGSVLAWGDNFAGQLAVPQEALTGVTAIAAGGSHSLALKTDGSVLAWGSNFAGQSTVPQEALTGVTAIAAGTGHSLALKPGGSVISWGRLEWPAMAEQPEAGRGAVDLSGGVQHSLATMADDEQEVPPAARTGVISFSTNFVHSLAVKTDGSVVGWGSNVDGEASPPPQYNRGVLAVAAGWYFSLVVVEDIE